MIYNIRGIITFRRISDKEKMDYYFENLIQLIQFVSYYETNKNVNIKNIVIHNKEELRS
jgi:hypothetical protein